MGSALRTGLLDTAACFLADNAKKLCNPNSRRLDTLAAQRPSSPRIMLSRWDSWHAPLCTGILDRPTFILSAATAMQLEYMNGIPYYGVPWDEKRRDCQGLNEAITGNNY